METRRELLARRGLILARRVRRRLDEVGIHARPDVSLEHQHLANRYVVRGVESGGAVAGMGRYVTFAGESGEPLPYLQPIDTLGVNGVHAVVVAPVLVRIELLRAGRTYQLLITMHQPEQCENGRRPRLDSTILFRGVNGFLDLEPWGRDRGLAEPPVPQFWSRGGEVLEIPKEFEAAVRAAVKGTCCIGCSHAHYLRAPMTVEPSGVLCSRHPRDIGRRRGKNEERKPDCGFFGGGTTRRS
jgi:hypothetical protein